MKEERILGLLRRKEPQALEMVIDQYTAYVSCVVWNILQGSMTPADAEEVVCDVFLALWNQAEQVQSGRLKAWLAAVARNQARHKLRQLGKDLKLEEDFLELSEDGLEGNLIAQEERQAVRQAVEDLGEPDREIFLRHYYYIQPIEEISREMGINLSTVKSKLRRGRQKLKTMLQEGGTV